MTNNSKFTIFLACNIVLVALCAALWLVPIHEITRANSRQLHRLNAIQASTLPPEYTASDIEDTIVARRYIKHNELAQAVSQLRELAPGQAFLHVGEPIVIDGMFPHIFASVSLYLEADANTPQALAMLAGANFAGAHVAGAGVDVASGRVFADIVLLMYIGEHQW